MDYQQPPQGQGYPDPNAYQQQGYQAPPPPPNYGGYPPQGGGGYPPPGGPVPGKGKATAALICGIVSAVLGFFLSYFFIPAILGLAAGVVGLILSIQARKTMPPMMNGMATAALILSIIGLCWNGVFFFVCGICTICSACGSASALGGLASLF